MIATLLRVLGPVYARPVRRTIALMTVTAVAEGLSYALLVPVLRALLGPEPATARPALVAFGAAVGAYAILRYRSDRAGFRVGTTLLRGVYHRLGDHLARLPLGWYGAGRVGEVSTMAGRGVFRAMSVIAHLLGPFLSACVTPLTIVVVLLAFDWRLGSAALLAAPLVASAQVWAARAAAGTDADRAERDRDATDQVVEYLQAQPVLRTGGRTAERFARLDDALTGIERASRRSTRAALPGIVGAALSVQATFTALLVLGAYLALNGDVGAAELLAALVLAARCADPLLALSDLSGALRAARSELDRLDALLQTAPLPEPAHPEEPRGYGLEFDGVVFRHARVSFTAAPGQRLAIVGPSGAGKTTVLQLLARFHDVDAGAVRIGGVDVRAIGTDALLDRIAIVFQDVYLFDGTIEENVRLGRPGATDADLRAAATAAQLDEVIARLPEGWASPVGEGGALLSGGERQRVSIARALLKDAPVVLLDEVTSALDPANAAAVHEGVERLMAGRTVVVVTHHLETARTADHIVFLENGCVVEEGSHASLVERGGRYAGFWNSVLVRDQP
ncbi:ABC transporter ATP-binding protein [Cryptosporangium arvum]|uniref:ABC transporter ATP-binding protein n=1 Tax=Cryptosporangium arvum TaxID=80871 RepID=UPI0004AFDEFA|nr:ABC transporter ATP-binding protein [Cryptosporangium arvum]